MSKVQSAAVPPRVALLVEDNPGDARLVREHLAGIRERETRLEHVTTLSAALGRLRTSPPDLVLLDLDLPDSHDIGTVRAVVDAAPDVPVIVLTGRHAGEDAVRALRAGAQDFLVKETLTSALLERSVRYAIERKAVAEELRWQERRFRMIAEHIEEVFYIWDLGSEPPSTVFVSSAYEEVFGLSADELLEDGLAFLEAVHPDDRQGVARALEQGSIPDFDREYRIVRPDGEIRWISAKNYRVDGDGEESRWAVGLAIDITEQVRLREEVRREHERFEEIFRDAPALIVTFRGPEHEIEMANPAFRRASGGRELVGRTVRQAFPELEGQGWWEMLDRVFATGEPSEGREKPVRLEGSPEGGSGDAVTTLYVSYSCIPRLEDGEPVGLLALGNDVTRAVRAREEAEHNRELLTRTLETTADGILRTDAEGVFRYANPAAARLLGVEIDEIVGRPYNAASWRIAGPDGEFFPDEDLPVARVLRTGSEVVGVEHAVERPDGTRVVLSVNAAPVRSASGDQGVVASIRDVTARRQFEADLRHRALHDYLTGLPNRALLMDRIDHALDRSRRTGERLAVLFLDLDRFKTVNDSLGHEAGDRVLEEVARRLSGTVRERDTVARVGGDEFTIVLEDVAGERSARQTAERVLEVLSEPIVLGDDRVLLDASVGIVLHTAQPRDREVETRAGVERSRLISLADRAMLRVKGLAGQRIAVAAEDDEDEEEERHLTREMQLREAITAESLTTVYQPIFDLEVGLPVAAEALARWTDPERGEVDPETFIPVAEETGLIVVLGEQQMETACRDAAAWPTVDGGGRRLAVHVNLSARQLSDPNLLERIRSVLGRTATRPERLVLEVTESAALQEASKLDALKDMGFELAVDDFGTRYATLAQIKRLSVDALKIDKSFVRGLEHNRSDRAIVEATLTLGKAMGLEVIAEGIETDDQLRLLREMGCRRGQGFGLARPMSGDDLIRWMEERPGR